MQLFFKCVNCYLLLGMEVAYLFRVLTSCQSFLVLLSRLSDNVFFLPALLEFLDFVVKFLFKLIVPGDCLSRGALLHAFSGLRQFLVAVGQGLEPVRLVVLPESVQYGFLGWNKNGCCEKFCVLVDVLGKLNVTEGLSMEWIFCGVHFAVLKFQLVLFL